MTKSLARFKQKREEELDQSDSTPMKMTCWFFVLLNLLVVTRSYGEEAKDRSQRPIPKVQGDIESVNDTLVNFMEQIQDEVDAINECLNPPYKAGAHSYPSHGEEGVRYDYECDIAKLGGADEPHVACKDGTWTSTEVDIRCVDLNQCYYLVSGKALYSGTNSYTQGGIECASWKYPGVHIHTYTDSHFYGCEGTNEETLGKAQNYCRDPDFTGRPWCYTTSFWTRWDYCAVSQCQ